MPTYNRAARLQKALTSALQQSYETLEIIVSDNASSDETWDVCSTVAANDRRVRVYRQSVNMGPVANFEFVRSKASGKYFMWLADDDAMSSNYVASCVERLERDPELVLAHGAATYLRDDGTACDETVFALDKAKPIARVLTYFWRVSQNGMFYGLYRREAITDCRMPNTLGGDWAWIADVALHGKTAVQSEAKIRRSGTGTSASYERILEVVGAARWKRYTPSLTLAVGLGAHAAFRSAPFRTRHPLARFAVAPLITAILCYRLIARPALGRLLSPIRSALRSGKNATERE